MSQQVAFLSRGLGKTFPTVLAFIWLLASVDPLMRCQVPGLSKLFGAIPALEWFLTGMNPHVNLKIGNFFEALPHLKDLKINIQIKLIRQFTIHRNKTIFT